MNTDKIINNLSHFTGSEEWHKWSYLFAKDLLTDGAKYLADEAQCYWLMDAIASHQLTQKVKNENFQVWLLSHQLKGWRLSCDEGNGRVLVEQKIEHSDFPLDSIKLYACRNELGGITIMLPSEY